MSEKSSRCKRARLFKGDPCVLPGVGAVFSLDTCPQDLTIFKRVCHSQVLPREPTCTTTTEGGGTVAGYQRQQLVADIDEGDNSDGEPSRPIPPTACASRSRVPLVGGCVEGSNLNSRHADQHHIETCAALSCVCEPQDSSITTHALGDKLEDANHSLQLSPSTLPTPLLGFAETGSPLVRQAEATKQSGVAAKASEQPPPTAPAVGTVDASISNALAKDYSPLRPTGATAAASSEGGREPGAASDGEKIGHSTPRLATAAGDQRSSTVDNAGQGALSIHGGSLEREQEQPRVTASPPAVSMVASFFRQAVAGTPSPASVGKRPSSAASPPTTPMPLASLVSGVPGSGGSGGRGHGTAGGGRACGSLSSATGLSAAAPGSTGKSPASRGRAGGRSRFCNEEWPARVKERRRILRFPNRSEPPGTRILYWVRGSFRIRDNLALSVAMWLSRELQMPLQALTFVDPMIGRVAASSCRSASEHELRQPRRSPDTRGYDTTASLPFRMAVESSALCEMEQELRALNIPLTAISCAEGEIPSALALWCNDPKAKGPTKTAVRTSSQAVMTLPLSRVDGGVHVAITDECYHPRQLWLAELAAKALPSVALYTVDSCSCCPINTFHGRRTAKPSAGDSAASREEYRHAQDGMLKTVCTELGYRPRLPLEARLQTAVFVGGVGGRAALPRGFAVDSAESTVAAYATLDWGILQALWAQRFPGFGKPLAPSDKSSTSNPSTQDFIAVMGGGERAAEKALRQTLSIAAALGALESKKDGAAGRINCANGVGDGNQIWQDSSTFLENEISGVGFGGALLHLLRVGSISPLYVIQALLDRSKDASANRYGGTARWNASALLLEKVLNREYVLYRSYFFYQKEGRACVSATMASNGHGAPRPNLWRVKDWQHLIPRWVMEELQKGQRDKRQHPHTPEEIKRAGSNVPSSVGDPLFSAIQVRLTNGGRLHPILGPYWARGMLRMLLLPSQAIALVITLAEDLCLGAAHAGDIVPELLADAFDAFRPAMAPSSPPGAVPRSPGSRATQPIFRGLSAPPISSREGLESALGGAEALTRFISPVSILRGN